MDLKSEIRASVSRPRRDTGAAASSKNSLAGKIRRKRSGQVCRSACDFQSAICGTLVFRRKSSAVPSEIHCVRNYPTTHCHELESIYYDSNTKSGRGSKKVQKH